MPSREFQRDLADAHARVLERSPEGIDEEALADSPEVAGVLRRYKRPTPPHDPARGQAWARAIIESGLSEHGA